MSHTSAVSGDVASGAERKLVAVLKVLSESHDPLGSITIARELTRHGINLSERAVRYYLILTDARGYTRPLGRGGRMLTPQGLAELKVALAPEQLGFTSEKLENLTLQTDFDPATGYGRVPINTTLVARERLAALMRAAAPAFQKGLAVSDMVAVAPAGEKLGAVIVPEGKVGLGTVCSTVINGVLLKAGVPMESKFSGVLEISDGAPSRFVAVINYNGTSLDPAEQYIRARMTDITGVVRHGHGRILASFREIPAAARSNVEAQLKLLGEAGINGVMVLGNTSQAVCQVAVGLNHIGLVLITGLNPIAAAQEAGFETENLAESGVYEYEKMVPYTEFL